METCNQSYFLSIEQGRRWKKKTIQKNKTKQNKT